MEVKVKSVRIYKLCEFINNRFSSSIAIRALFKDQYDFYINNKREILDESINNYDMLDSYSFDRSYLSYFSRYCLINKNGEYCECLFSDADIKEVIYG